MQIMNTQVVTFENNAGLLLPAEMLRQIGLNIGDKLEIAVNERSLVVRSAQEADRTQLIAAATREIFDQRREAYLELAKGVA